MKKFIIKNEMLGRKEVVKLLTTPLHRNILILLQEEADMNDDSRIHIERILQSLNSVRMDLKHNSADIVTSVNVYDALRCSDFLPLRYRRLLGPQIEALSEIAPKLNILSEIKQYMTYSVCEYMLNRGSYSRVIEETVFMLDKLDIAQKNIPAEDFQAIMTLFRRALGDATAPLYVINSKHTSQEIIIADVFSAILNDNSVKLFCPIFGKDRNIKLAKSLGYSESEIWTLKVLSVRNVCNLIYWQYDLSFEDKIFEVIDMLKFAYELSRDVLKYIAEDETMRLYHISKQIKIMLNKEIQDVHSASKNFQKAIEYFNAAGLAPFEIDQ